MKSLASLIGAVALATLSLSVHAQGTLPNLQRGSELFSQSCMACHGADGNSPTAANPSLAQQHPEYLIKQLRDYKSGARASAVMAGFAAALSEADKRDISFWLASQKAAPNFARDKEKARLGERIYRGGLFDRRVPACMACHAPNGVGMPALYPRLAGQHADYTVAQMKAFRSGERANSPMMTHIARHMTDQEIAAVADFIAGLR